VNQQLRILADEYWDYQMEIRPTEALMLGDHRFDTRVEEVSREAEDTQIARLREFSARAGAFRDLDSEDQITRDVMIHEASTAADALESRAAEFAVNHAMGFQALIPVVIPQLPIETSEQADALIEKYRGFGQMFDEAAGRLEEGLANGRTPPAPTTQKTVEQLDALLAAPIDADPFLRVRVPATLDSAEAEAWRSRLADEVVNSIRPAIRRYRDTIANDVLPVARPEERSGVTWLPGGNDLYQKAIFRYTTLELSR
jgi:uncharacterized protein (DUF885 family)